MPARVHIGSSTPRASSVHRICLCDGLRLKLKGDACRCLGRKEEFVDITFSISYVCLVMPKAALTSPCL